MEGYFAKKGIPWHVSAVMTKCPTKEQCENEGNECCKMFIGPDHIESSYFFDIGNSDQSCHTTFQIIQSVISRVKKSASTCDGSSNSK
eukprot:UN23277